MVKIPCYKCENRTDSCHGTCKEYQEWSRKREEYRNRVFQEREQEWNLYYYKSHIIKKTKRQ